MSARYLAGSPSCSPSACGWLGTCSCCCQLFQTVVCCQFAYGSNNLNWNIRGLNNPARRQTIFNLIKDSAYNIICLQETKLAMVDKSVIVECLGTNFLDNFIAKEAVGTHGGIIIAVAHGFSITLDQAASGTHFLSGIVVDLSTNSSWSLRES